MIKKQCRVPSILIPLIKSTKTKSQLLQLHSHLVHSSLLCTPSVSSSFLSRLSQTFKPPDVSYIHKVFISIPNPPASVFTTMIFVFSVSDSPLKGLHIFQQMHRFPKRISPVTLSSLLKCFLRLSSFPSGSQIHAMVFKEGFHSDTLLLTNLIELYSNLSWEDAGKVFEEMRERDTVAYNVMMSSCLRCNRATDALALFNTMSVECQPDDVTCLLAVQACSTLGELESGMKVHELINQYGYATSCLGNSLVSMYFRCGSVEKAYQQFHSMKNKSVVTWTALITGLAKNGKANEAIAAFEEMRQRHNIRPGEQTLTGLLNACSHAGHVDLGMKYFKKMQTEFNLAPNVHHYGCVVDLLARKGLLQEALAVITSMGVKQDVTIWRTLLGACKIHGDFHMAARAVERIVELKGEEAGDLVLLINIYSSRGNHQKVSELRTEMQRRKIRTTTRCSSICLNGRVHYFNADEVSHERIKEVYETLEEIHKQLRIFGYGCGNAGTSCHSEKLAIAYGVLETPPGTAIKVAKDDRICDDCHRFVETFSSVYNRKVYVKDRYRTHNFRCGRCTCTF